MLSPHLEHFEDDLSIPCKRKARELDEQPKVCRQSAVSRSSSTSEFLDAKAQDTKLDLMYSDTLMKGMSEALTDGLISRKDYDDACHEITKYDLKRGQEYVVLKRQKKIILEDLDDMRPSIEKLEDGYASVVVHKVMVASAKQKKKKLNQSACKQAVLKYYEAPRSRVPEGPTEELFCVLTGQWHGAKAVEVTHRSEISQVG
ncbi:MAG: hypothetical protein Q9203_007066 [Teloschistes exilis]